MSRLDGPRLNGGMLIRATAGVLTSGVVTAASVYQPMMLLGASAVVLVLIVGVVLPAVWSRKKQRRVAAARVLRELLTTIRPAIPRQ